MRKFPNSVTCVAVCLCMLAASVACDDTKTVFVPEAVVGLTPSTDVVFTYRGGERAIAVRTNQREWEVRSDQPWCEVTPNAASDCFVIRATPNHAVEARPEAVVTVTTSADRLETNFATMRLRVNQTGFERVDLSEGGCANCYVVSGPGYYRLDARVKGQSGTATAPDFTSCRADWVWMTQEGMLSVLSDAGDGFISFVCEEFTPGNAVVALVSNDEIVWSWHLWFTNLPLEPRQRNMMPVNLGAVSDRAGDVWQFGLFYQWGRKDPFIGPSGTGNYPEPNLDSDERVPFAVGEELGESYTAANAVNTDLVAAWGVSDAAEAYSGAEASALGTTFFLEAVSLPEKEMRWGDENDPCPPGWHVPSVYELDNYLSKTYCTILWSEYQGVMRGEDRIPGQGFRHFLNGRLCNVGHTGFCWANNAKQYQMAAYRYAVGFDANDRFQSGDILITEGFGVRCSRRQ